MLISSGYSGIFRKFLHRLAFSPPLLLSATWLGLLRLSYLLLLVYLRCEFLEREGGGGVDLLDCFNQFASQYHFNWLFLLLWLLKACENVYKGRRFHLEFHLLFSLFQCFCSIESEAEVRLLSVSFPPISYPPSTLCLFVSSVMVCCGSWTWWANLIHFMEFSIFGYFCSNFITLRSAWCSK